jgi:hypothetical protein
VAPVVLMSATAAACDKQPMGDGHVRGCTGVRPRLDRSASRSARWSPVQASKHPLIPKTQ